MAKILLIFSLLICFFSVFLVIDDGQLRPYQEMVKSYVPSYANHIIESGVTFLRAIFFGIKGSDVKSVPGQEKIFTKTELSRFVGKDGGDIYLALLGRVYDVTKGRRHYGPDGGYNGFAGRDGSRAFITGEFNEEGLVENVDGLTLTDILGLDGWQLFYERDYTYIGKLEGEFYDRKGQPTASLQRYEEQLKEAKKKQALKEAETRRFPPCNSEWKKETGTRLWCSNKSGGIERNWVGVPREFHEPGRRTMRCACIRNSGPPSDNIEQKDHKDRGDLDNPRFKSYPGCDPHAVSCFV